MLPSSITPTLSLHLGRSPALNSAWGNAELDGHFYTNYHAPDVQKIVKEFSDVDLKTSPLFFADRIWSVEHDCVIEHFESIIVSRWKYNDALYIKLADGNVVNISEFAKSYAL